MCIAMYMLFVITEKEEGVAVKKGIFWCYVMVFDDDMYSHVLQTVMVSCDRNGTPTEKVEFSSKSGENFNHKIKWEKLAKNSRHPYNYFPRGRVEISKGVVRIFANPVILAEEEAKNLIVTSFELEGVKDEIKWIADNSAHYCYVVDAMSGFIADQ